MLCTTLRSRSVSSFVVPLLAALFALPFTADPASALLGGLLGGGGGVGTCAPSPACHEGLFSPPFAEPTLLGQETEARCVEASDGELACKPAAGTLTLLADDRILYLNALEGTEDIELSVVAEFGVVSVNDQSRLLSFDALGSPSWSRPSPVDGGANPDGHEPTELLPGLAQQGGADGALFCSDVVFLADGRLLAAGGTDYYNEPGLEGVPLGVAELEGLKNARIFDPADDGWSQSGSMAFGRWYPTLVSLANADVFVASGVSKLLKPVYSDRPMASGRNTVETETYDPACGAWSDNGPLAERSLPLFPRLHLLPNGHVYYNAGGQAFNPMGQSYDQALWNLTASYDPATRSWSDLAVAGLPLQLNEVGLEQLATALNPSNPLAAQTLLGLLADAAGTVTDDPGALLAQAGSLLGLTLDPDALETALGSGMRGSTFSVMLPLRPDADGAYRRAEFLTAGGVPSYTVVASPGGYFATPSSRIDAVTVAADGSLDSVSRLTGPLARPRWYGSATLLPTGEVLATSGADRDGVAAPGVEIAVRQAEIFDPETETWRPVATQNNPRTYHNTALLLRDGRVLVGGHAPITTGYLSHIDLQELGFAPNDGRDPSFEIYSPPYVYRDRPEITEAPASASLGQTFRVHSPEARAITSVVLMRRTATTHLVDADQRAVVLPIVRQRFGYVDVRMPASHAVAPGGPYMLFIVTRDADGTAVPSLGEAFTVPGPTGSCGI